MRSIFRKPLSVIMSIVLAVGLCPGLAYAAPASAQSQAPSQDANELAAGSSTTFAPQNDGDIIEITPETIGQFVGALTEYTYQDTTWRYTDATATYGMAVTFADDESTQGAGGDYIEVCNDDGKPVIFGQASDFSGRTVYIKNSTSFTLRMQAYSSNSERAYSFKVTAVRNLAEGEVVPDNAEPGSYLEGQIAKTAILRNGENAASWATYALAQACTGSSVNFTVSFDEKVISLQEGTDFQVSWLDYGYQATEAPSSPGSYVVRVSGVGDHYGWWNDYGVVLYCTADEFTQLVNGLSFPSTLTVASVREFSDTVASLSRVYDYMPSGYREAVPQATLDKLEAFKTKLYGLVPMSSLSGSWTINGMVSYEASSNPVTFDYDGQPHGVTVAATYDGQPLREGVDYEVVYFKGSPDSDQVTALQPTAGTYNVGIRGIGDKFYGLAWSDSALVVNMGSPSAVLYKNGDLVIQRTQEADGSAGHTANDIVKTYVNADKRITVNYGEGDGAWSQDVWPWYEESSSIKTVTVRAPVVVQSAASWFSGLDNLESASLVDFCVDGNNGTAGYLFSGCQKLSSVNLSGVNVDGGFYNAFSWCYALSSFTFDENTRISEGILPEGKWVLSGGSQSYATTAELAQASRSGSVAGTWAFTYKKDLATAYVNWRSRRVAYVEGGLPDISGVVTSITFNGVELTEGVDYKLVIVDANGNEVQSAAAGDNQYYVRPVGLGEFAGTQGNDWAISVYVPTQAILYKNGDFVIQQSAIPDGAAGHTSSDVTRIYDDVEKYVTVTHGSDSYSWTTEEVPWYQERDSIKAVSVSAPAATTQMIGWFEGCENLATVSLAGLSTSDNTSVYDLFHNCPSLVSIDLSGIDMSKWSDGLEAYYGCYALSSFTFSATSVLAAGMLPEGKWTSPSNETYETTAAFVEAFNANPAAGTWGYAEDKDLARARVYWGGSTVSYVEGGVPDVSNLASVYFNGALLRQGSDYEVIVTDADGNRVTSASISEGVYYACVWGLGDFAGTKSASRQALDIIDRYDLGKALRPDVLTARYTGKPYSETPSSMYTSTGEYLQRNVDFTVSFETTAGKQVVPIEPGTYRVVYTGCGLYHGAAYGTLRIAEKNDLYYADVNVNNKVQWVGKVVNAVLVTVCGTPVTVDSDYTIKYYDEQGHELSSLNAPGVYTFAISPGTNGKYTGERSWRGTSYNAIRIIEGDEEETPVEPLDMRDLENASVSADGVSLYSWSSTSFLDKGQGITPTITVRADGVELTEGVHYKVRWRDYRYDESAEEITLPLRYSQSATYYVTLTAIAGSGYTGSTTRVLGLADGLDFGNATMELAKQDVIVGGIPVIQYTGNPIDVQATMTMGGDEIPAGSYKLLFAKCEGSANDKGAIVGTFSDVAPVERGLYCVYAQPTSGSGYSGIFKGNRYNYSPSYANAVYVQVGDVNDISYGSMYGTDVYNHTGAAIHPQLTVYFNGKYLKEGVDYEIAGYRNTAGALLAKAIDEGSYTVVVRGIGDYTGTLEMGLRVREYGNFSEALLTYNSEVPYTGQAAYPDITVKFGDEELVEGVDYRIESVEHSEWGNAYSAGPVAIGNYVMTLRGVAARGIVGERTISYSIVDGRNIGYATVTGLDETYAYTGKAVNPKPTSVSMNGKTLVEGRDYVIEYRQSDNRLITSCVDEGYYTLRVVGYGDYAFAYSKGFTIMDPNLDFSKAKVYLLKGGSRELLASTYPYTGENLFEGGIQVELNGKVLDPSKYHASCYKTSGSSGYSGMAVQAEMSTQADGSSSSGYSVLKAVDSGSYYLYLTPVDTSEYYRSGYFNFTIEQPEATQGSVTASGSVLVDAADAAAGTDVELTVIEKPKASSTTAQKVVEACNKVHADYVAIADVTLDVVKENGEVVRRLTDNLGDLRLSFKVGAEHNGKAARVVQMHKDPKTGVMEALRHPVTRVVNGMVTTPVDRLSEFVIMVGANAEDLEFERASEVAKPEAVNAAYDGKEHVGVAASEAYTLTGTVRATNVGTYSVTATLAQGYAWTDGSTDPVTVSWRIYTEGDRIDIAKATIALDATSYTYTGEEIRPGVTVTYNGTTLVRGADYTLKYADNVNVGTQAKVIVTGLNAFKNDKTVNFEIKAKAADPVDGKQDDAKKDDAKKDDGKKDDAKKDDSKKDSEKSDAAPAKEKSDLASYAGKAKAAGFTDLAADAWYMNDGGRFPGSQTLYLDYTIARGLMSGYAGTTLFGPDDDLSRGMAATIIYRMATGKTAKTTNNDVATKFSDVKSGAWYAAAVKWCSDNGVVTGYSGTDKFGPEDPITREQLATIIGRYMDKDGKAGKDVSQFKDKGDISDYAQAGIAYCNANKIMTGIGDTGNFQPGGKATRCQMSKVIAVTARMAE